MAEIERGCVLAKRFQGMIWETNSTATTGASERERGQNKQLPPGPNVHLNVGSEVFGAVQVSHELLVRRMAREEVEKAQAERPRVDRIRGLRLAAAAEALRSRVFERRQV
eukprot:1874716-Pleurochrysis_carterae.AAC.2